MPKIEVGPDHYVLICARQYAASLRKLRAEPRESERLRHTRMLHYLMDAGMCEADVERRKREMRLAAELRDHIEKRKLLSANRLITAEEAELIRDACSVPPVATMENLTAEDMAGLADMYEGWAQDQRNASFEMARLLGWADGMRVLAEAIGADYEPPAKVPGEPDSVLKFLANRMRRQST